VITCTTKTNGAARKQTSGASPNRWSPSAPAAEPAFPQLLIAFHNVSVPTDLDAYVTRIGDSARVIRQLIVLSKMIAIQEEVGFEGDLPAFFRELREDKENPLYYYPDTDEGRQAYIDDATAAIGRIEAELSNYFGILLRALVGHEVHAEERPGGHRVP
jgi:hypothetical protein